MTVGERAIEGGQGFIFPATMFGTHVVAKLPKDNTNIEVEIGLLGRATHPNVIRLLAWCEKDGKQGKQQYLVMESAKETISRRLQNAPDVVLRRRWVSEIAQALAWLHQCDPPIVHGDLREANILVSAHDEIKLIDFGLANSASTRLGGNRDIHLKDENSSCEADMLNFGVVVLHMLSGHACSIATQKERALLCTWLDVFTTSDTAKKAMDTLTEAKEHNLLQECLSPHPDKRPKASRAVEVWQPLALVSAPVYSASRPGGY